MDLEAKENKRGMDNNKPFELPFACQQQFINTSGFKTTLTKMYKGNVQQIHL